MNDLHAPASSPYPDDAKRLLKANFYIELGRGHFISANAPDTRTLGKWFKQLSALYSMDEELALEWLRKERKPFELKVQEWWLT